MSAIDRAESGIIVAWIKPFTFKVRIQDGTVIPCGLERAFFGRITPDAAMRRIERNGPHIGDEVSLRVLEDSRHGARHGLILRSR